MYVKHSKVLGIWQVFNKTLYTCIIIGGNYWERCFQKEKARMRDFRWWDCKQGHIGSSSLILRREHWEAPTEGAAHSDSCSEFAKEDFEVEWGPCGAMSRLELTGGRSNGHTDIVRKACEWKGGEPVDSEREPETQRHLPAERKWIMLMARVLAEDQGLLHLSPSIALPSMTFPFNSPWA